MVHKVPMARYPRRFSKCAIPLIALLIASPLAQSHRSKYAKTTSLFDEDYKPDESRHYQVSESSTFAPDAKKQFDLSYADGTELKGFNGVDVVHVRNPLFSAIT